MIPPDFLLVGGDVVDPQSCEINLHSTPVVAKDWTPDGLILSRANRDKSHILVISA